MNDSMKCAAVDKGISMSATLGGGGGLQLGAPEAAASDSNIDALATLLT
jgi:hypothetical protein